jgi:RNase P subunit RPR2
MPLERVALIPTCAECEAVWLPADEARWQAWLTEDEPPELVFYCRECAEREFGGEKAV